MFRSLTGKLPLLVISFQALKKIDVPVFFLNGSLIRGRLPQSNVV
jgi:hypothetical protein